MSSGNSPVGHWLHQRSRPVRFSGYFINVCSYDNNHFISTGIRYLFPLSGNRSTPVVYIQPAPARPPLLNLQHYSSPAHNIFRHRAQRRHRHCSNRDQVSGYFIIAPLAAPFAPGIHRHAPPGLAFGPTGPGILIQASAIQSILSERVGVFHSAYHHHGPIFCRCVHGHCSARRSPGPGSRNQQQSPLPPSPAPGLLRAPGGPAPGLPSFPRLGHRASDRRRQVTIICCSHRYLHPFWHGHRQPFHGTGRTGTGIGHRGRPAGDFHLWHRAATGRAGHRPHWHRHTPRGLSRSGCWARSRHFRRFDIRLRLRRPHSQAPLFYSRHTVQSF